MRARREVRDEVEQARDDVAVERELRDRARPPAIDKFWYNAFSAALPGGEGLRAILTERPEAAMAMLDTRTEMPELYLKNLNPESRRIVRGYVEPAAAQAAAETSFQLTMFQNALT